MATVSPLSEWLTFLHVDVSTLLVFLVTFMAAMWFLKKPRQNLPPSVPGGWPLIGHVLESFVTFLREWPKQYGDVYSVKVGLWTLVVVSGYTAIKEILDQDVFSSRMHAGLSTVIKNGAGIIFAPYGQAFRERRRFTGSALRRLGMKVGRGSIQEKIREEVQFLCDKIAGYEGDPVDIEADLATTVANVLCAMVFGKRFDYGDDHFRDLRHTVLNLQDSTFRATWAVPFITYVPGANSPFAHVEACVQKLRRFMLEEIDRHRLNLDPENPRDFIDYCILELDRSSATGEGLSEDNVVFIILDLFIAGIDTTTYTLSWLFLYMVVNPDVQHKVQTEIDSVVDRDTEKPRLEHRNQLPYTVATMMETQRIRNIACILLPRQTSVPSRFRGFDIPTGAMIIMNLDSVHMDPTVWPDPDKFDPDRFLGPDGKIVANPPPRLPFSAGKRICLGEQMAKMELFLIFSTVLQQFTLKPPDGEPIPSTEVMTNRKSLFMVTSPYKLCAVIR